MISVVCVLLPWLQDLDLGGPILGVGLNLLEQLLGIVYKIMPFSLPREVEF